MNNPLSILRGRRSVPGMHGRIDRRAVLGLASTGISLIACYGTLAVVAVASALGATVVLDEGLWAASIVFFAVVAAVLTLAGGCDRRNLVAGGLAMAAALLLAHVMFVRFDRLLELVGFGLLTAGGLADLWAGRFRAPQGGCARAARGA